MPHAIARAARTTRLCAFVALTAAGCRPDSSREALASVAHDSLGIHIIENARAKWSDGARLVIETVPDIDIGSEQQNGDITLVQVGGIIAFGTGQFAVVNGTDRQVLVFDASGQLQRRIARPGSGPRDLLRPTSAFYCGADTIAVSDGTRASLFQLNGLHIRETQLIPAVGDGSLRLAGVSTDCSELELVARPERLPPQGEPGIASATLFWVTGSASRRDTVDTFDHRQIVRRTLGVGGDQGISIPWTGEMRWATFANRTYVALATAAEVRVFDSRRKLSKIIRWKAPSDNVEDSDVQQYNTRREGVRKIAPGVAQLMPELGEFPEVPSIKPSHLGIVVDDSSRIWLRSYPNWIAGRPDLFDRDLPLYKVDDEPTVGELWQVFDSIGRWSGDVRMPARFAVRAISGSNVYGVWRDLDGAEHIRVYKLRTTASP